MVAPAGKWAATAIATTAASMGYSAYTAHQEAKSQAAIAKYNQEVAQQEALAKERAGKAAVEEKREETRRLLAAQRARYGASGVSTEGTPILVQLEQAKRGALDAWTMGQNIRAGVRRSRAEADIYGMRAKSAKRAGRLGVGQSLFSGGVQMARLRMGQKLL